MTYPQHDLPLIIVEKIKGALVIVALDRLATEAGLSKGMTLATARALCPALDVAERDRLAERRLIEQIASWMERYTPCVGLIAADRDEQADVPEGISLDITGAAHLLGGEASLLEDCLTRIRAHGFEARAAIAKTAECAAAFARFKNDATIIAQGAEEQATASLPIAALGLPSRDVIALARLGLKTVEDLATRPRAPLAARFGRDLLMRLDRVRGCVDTPISPRRFIPAFITERRFAEPIGHEDDIHRTILTLSADLARVLEKQGQGGRRFELGFFRTDGTMRRLSIETARALRDPKSVMRLFRERLDMLADPLDPGFGFDVIRLSVPVAEPLEAHEPDFDGRADLAEDLAALVEKLGVRLHPSRVMRLHAEDSHLPERAMRRLPAQDGNAALATTWDHDEDIAEPPLRPIRLIDPPEPLEVVVDQDHGCPIRFRWRRVFHVVVKAEGPERIAPEWWRMTGQTLPPTRDYYRIENEQGARFWLFRAGLYERETHEPRWFMHGLFG